MTTKRCFKCGEVKPLTEFYAHKAMADGHLGKCKSCTKADSYNRRHVTGRDAVLSYEKLRSLTPKRVANARLQSDKWSKQYPERRRTHVIVRRALLSGSIQKWPVCSVPECCTEKVVAHHADYDRPLDVVWLCQAHHKQAHAIAHSSVKDLK